MKYFLLFVVIILFNSCDIKKEALKTKTDRTITESTEKITKRKGDTVIYVIPNIKYKDTTIYTTNREGTTLRTVYNDQGDISAVECYASLIEVTERNNRLLEESIKDKESNKTENFDSSIILYGFLGIGLVIIVISIVFFFYIKKGILVR
jgi:hypothetical protein